MKLTLQVRTRSVRGTDLKISRQVRIMAKITEIGLSGSLGTLVFYKNRGVQCSRTKPARVRLSKESLKSARLFGIAAAMSAPIRRELISLLPAEKNPKIMYRLNAVLFQ